MILLIKSNELSAIQKCLGIVGLKSAELVYFKSDEESTGFHSLFQLLVQEPNFVMQNIQNCSPLLIENDLKSNPLGLPSYWTFSLQNNHSTLPLVIGVDSFTAYAISLPPFWLRSHLEFVEVRYRMLLFLSAYTSTLGGGHFLCKHVTHAWKLAIKQESIALALEDYNSAGLCRVHRVYILLQLGFLKEAQKRLKREKKYALNNHLEKLISIVMAAQVYLNNLTLSHSELEKPIEEGNKLQDNYYRQRFIKL